MAKRKIRKNGDNWLMYVLGGAALGAGAYYLFLRRPSPVTAALPVTGDMPDEEGDVVMPSASTVPASTKQPYTPTSASTSTSTKGQQQQQQQVQWGDTVQQQDWSSLIRQGAAK